MLSRRWVFALVGLFALTRLYIWIARPTVFTEIIYSYMPYAHRWASGEVPYLQMWYEYPPATIPLFFIPHVLDMIFNGLTYSQFYRGILLIFDCFLFFLIYKSLKKQQLSPKIITGGLMYYCVVTLKAHAFMYDTMDLVFTTCMFAGVVSPLLINHHSTAKTSTTKLLQSFFEWTGYFLATGLKLINAPLGMVYAILRKKQLASLFFGMLIAGTLIWGYPLLKYRSSLQVMFVYHQIRGLQIESAPAVIARTLDRFSQSETIIEAYKNYEITGPMSLKIKRIYDWLFPAALTLLLLWGSYKAFFLKEKGHQFFRLHITLVYILLFMLVAKVLSTPFLLWHIPFVSVYPFKNLRQQLSVTTVSFLIIAASMTKIPDLPLGIFSVHILLSWIRILGFAYLFIRISLLGQQMLREFSHDTAAT